MVPITFTKATGAGNDFVIIDGFECPPGPDLGPLARALCDRHFGIGADGLLVILPGEGVDFEMQYYNADGSTGGMCGNGGRCAVRYAHTRGLVGPSVIFRAVGNLYRAMVLESLIRLAMTDPRLVRAEQVLHVGDIAYRGHLLDTGAPHLVIFSKNLESLDVVTVGRALRHHPDLRPEGANINFVSIDADGGITVRTYERGVEEETLACGTGSVACAAAASLFGGLQSPVTVRVRSGNMLRVEMQRSGNRFSDVVLEGPARLLFTGSCQYDPASGTITDEPMSG